VILAVVLSLVVAAGRYRSEQANRTVQVALDFGQVSLLSRALGVPRAELLASLREAGAGAILVKEPLVSELDGELLWGIYPVWLRLGRELAAAPYLEPEAAAQLRPDYSYLVFDAPRVAEEVAAQLGRRLPGGSVRLLPAVEFSLVELSWTKSDLSALKVGIGLAGFPWEEVERAGVKVIPQLRPWPAADAASVRAALEELYPHRDDLSALAFDGDRVPGYPRFVSDLGRGVQELDVPVAIIEFTQQQGLVSLVKLTGKRAVRLHSIRAEEAENLSPAQAVARFGLAAGERNVRILVVRFALAAEGGMASSDAAASARRYLEFLKEGLAAQGLAPGDPRPFTPFPLPGALFGLIGLGAWAAAVLLLRELGLRGRMLIGLSALGLAGYLLLLRADSVLARQAAAAVAAISFPTLGVLLWRREEPCSVPQALGRFAVTAALSLVGAALVVGLLGEVGFMLAVDQFLGTKVAHLAPPVLVAAALWGPGSREELRRRLASPVSWLALVALVVLALAGYVYLMRTGNEGTAFVSSWERALRQYLDQLLLVRPRTKEFLLGHPLLLLSYRLGRPRRYWLLWAAGSIGQASVVNTFAHVHTPLAVSLLRTAHGLWLGAIAGLILICLLEGYRRHRARRGGTEGGICTPEKP